MKKICFISLVLSVAALSLCSCDIGSNAGHVTVTDISDFDSPLESMLQKGELTSPKDPIPLSLVVNIENTYRKNIELGNAAFTFSDKNGKELLTANFTSPVFIPKHTTSDVPVEMELMFKNYAKLLSLMLLGNPDKILNKIFVSGSFTAKAGIIKKHYNINMMPLSDFVGYVFELNDSSESIELQSF